LLRLRSDEQLVGLFRAGNDEAFRAIHDRYRRHLLAYVRQMLRNSRSDPEDVVQDAFLRASQGLRAHDHELNLRPWLYKVARNACIDELRRHLPAPCAEVESTAEHDPVAESEQRETLRRLVTDLGRLPEQQRSALLMRELGGMSYAEVAEALGVSVPALKSLLVRARLGLVESLEARDTACTDIRGELASAHARGMRPNGLARRHLRDCAGCRQYRVEIRRTERRLAALAPTLGVLGPLTRLFGGGVTGGAAASSGTVTVLGASATHVAALVAATVIAVGSAVGVREVTATPSAPAHHPAPAQVVAPLSLATAAASSSARARAQTAAPASPRRVSAAASAGSAATRSTAVTTLATTHAAAPAASSAPTGASSSTTSSCPTGDASCGQHRSLTPTGNVSTSTAGGGGSTPPTTSSGTPAGSGSGGTAPDTSSSTPSGSGAVTSSPLGSQTSSASSGTSTAPVDSSSAPSGS
jgi:RNA polymerase sigma factor (sigma-70 family)